MYESDSLQIDAEYNEFFFILHLPSVEKLTKSIYLAGLQKLEEIKDFAKTIGYMSVYAAVYDGDMLTSKLIGRLGMEYKGSSDGFHVYEVVLKEED